MLEARVQQFYVMIKILERDAFLMEIGAFGACRQHTHQSQIAAVLSHDFYDKAAPRGYSADLLEFR